jgi:hypothetical protein
MNHATYGLSNDAMDAAMLVSQRVIFASVMLRIDPKRISRRAIIFVVVLSRDNVAKYFPVEDISTNRPGHLVVPVFTMLMKSSS